MYIFWFLYIFWGIIKLSPWTFVYLFVKNYGLCTEFWGAPLVNFWFPNMYPLCQSYIFTLQLVLIWQKIFPYISLDWNFVPYEVLCPKLWRILCKKSQMFVTHYHILLISYVDRLCFVKCSLLSTVFTNFAICRSISHLSEVSGFICWYHNFIMDI